MTIKNVTQHTLHKTKPENKTVTGMVGEDPRARGTEPHRPKGHGKGGVSKEGLNSKKPSEESGVSKEGLNSKKPSKEKKRIRKNSPPSLLETGDEENRMQAIRKTKKKNARI